MMVCWSAFPREAATDVHEGVNDALQLIGIYASSPPVKSDTNIDPHFRDCAERLKVVI